MSSGAQPTISLNFLREQRESILALAAQYKARNVRVFGSVARGQAQGSSDVDLLVDFAPDYTLVDRIGLQQELEDLLRCRVDVVPEAMLKAHVRPEALRDAVPL